MTAGKYRKKAIEVEAMQLTKESILQVAIWCGAAGESYGDGKIGLYIETVEGTMSVRPGDYIIKSVEGEFFPCKPDVFALTYEPVDA